MPGKEALRAVLVVDLAVDLDELAERAGSDQRLVRTEEALAFGLVEVALVLPLVDRRGPRGGAEVSRALWVERSEDLCGRDPPLRGPRPRSPPRRSPGGGPFLPSHPTPPLPPA